VLVDVEGPFHVKVNAAMVPGVELPLIPIDVLIVRVGMTVGRRGGLVFGREMMEREPPGIKRVPPGMPATEDGDAGIIGPPGLMVIGIAPSENSSVGVVGPIPEPPVKPIAGIVVAGIMGPPDGVYVVSSWRAWNCLGAAIGEQDAICSAEAKVASVESFILGVVMSGVVAWLVGAADKALDKENGICAANYLVSRNKAQLFALHA
jgi:hypothetical protein